MNKIEVSHHTWRDILKTHCENPARKQEVANLVGVVTVRTIDRWISGESNPQKDESIRKLALMSNEMRIALQHAFPEAFQGIPQPAGSLIEGALIPKEFYRRVARAYAHAPSSSRRWTLWHMLESQILPHLDPDGAGVVLFCLRQNGKTLQVVEGAGTTFWSTRQAIAQDMLNEESWLVQAAFTGSPLFIQSCAAQKLVPPPSILHHECIQSMAYFPLHFSGLIVGGLFLGSATEDFFTSLRKEIIEEYSCLVIMAFRDFLMG